MFPCFFFFHFLSVWNHNSKSSLSKHPINFCGSNSSFRRSRNNCESGEGLSFAFSCTIFLCVLMSKENPYLAHLPPSQRKINGGDDADPFKGMVPRKTTAEQAEKLENGKLNPFTNKPYSAKYQQILEGRRKLPVHAQRSEFLDMVHKSQFVVLVGETGSGKTTQYVLGIIVVTRH